MGPQPITPTECAFDVPRQIDGVESDPEWLEHRSLLIG